MTVSIENFLKAVYKQDKMSRSGAKLGILAKVLKISNAAATDMARKLAGRKLISYQPYKPITLTPKGNDMALNVLRKHRLWETFLFKTLNLSLHEIHREAEDLEHLTSDFLADKMDEFLEYPTTDPHGDPIPTVNGKIAREENSLILSETKAGEEYTVSRLASSEKDFFDFCKSVQITMGASVYVEKQYKSQKMTEIRIGENKIVLNNDISGLIYVSQRQKN